MGLLDPILYDIGYIFIFQNPSRTILRLYRLSITQCTGDQRTISNIFLHSHTGKLCATSGK